jgi:hypothetical protein
MIDRLERLGTICVFRRTRLFALIAEPLTMPNETYNLPPKATV